MNLTDKIIKAYVEGKPMPLKGHAKLTLTDQRTGEQKVIESDNMVTNAVADILSKNFVGMANFSSLLPLKNLFSGVLCFADEITEDADNYNPPAEDVNSMTACAGDQPHATANPYRGNPNGGESQETDTSIRFVWDWSTNQGNGPISCVSLVPGIFANMGLKPFDATINPLKNLGFYDNGTSNTWNESIAKMYPFNITGDNECVSVYANGSTFKEFTMRHDFKKLGIMRGRDGWSEASNRSATIQTFSSKSFIFDDEDYYYIGKVTSGTTVFIEKISKSDMSVSSETLTYSGVSLYTGNVYGIHETVRTFPFDGTYLYLPTTGNGCAKLNLTNTADVAVLTGTAVMTKGRSEDTFSEFHPPIIISDGLIQGSNYLINGDAIYPIKEASGVVSYDAYNTSQENYTDIIRYGAACYGQNKQTYYGSYPSYQGVILDNIFLSTINNLEGGEVVKTSAQTMKIEYTLTEV